MKQNTGSILFMIRKKKALKKSENHTIYVRVTINGEREEWGTGETAPLDKWSSANGGCMVGRSKETEKVNKALAAIRERIEEIKLQLIKSGVLSARMVRMRFEGRNEEKTIHQTILQIYQKLIDQKETQIGKKNGIVPQTFIKYLQTRDKMRLFLISLLSVQAQKKLPKIVPKYKRKNIESYNEEEILRKIDKTVDLPIQLVDHDFVNSYENFMISSNLTQNTANKHLRLLRQVVDIAFDNGYLLRHPFKNVVISDVKVPRNPLSEAQIQAVMALDVAKIKKENGDKTNYEEVKDVFLFCCFTGLPYGDVLELEQSDIVQDAKGNRWIDKNRKKTSERCLVPLSEIPEIILKKYEGQHENLLLPVSANYSMNRTLKKIAKACNIKSNVTTHIGRHTFATYALSKGVSIESVSKMLGHKNITTTQIYAKMGAERIEREMFEKKEEFNKFVKFYAK